MLLHESLGPCEKVWTQNSIYTPQSFLFLMSALDNTETRTMIALLLLVLVSPAFAVPLPSTDTDKYLLAEVRSTVSISDQWLCVAFLLVMISDLHTAFSVRIEQSNLDFSSHRLFLSLLMQRYLRRYYALPAGLQGGESSAGSFQTKVKEMQKFFKLKVIRCVKYLADYRFYLCLRGQSIYLIKKFKKLLICVYIFNVISNHSCDGFDGTTVMQISDCT